MPEKDALRFSCPCGHEGSNFTKINLVLNDSVITIEGEDGIVTEKVLSLFVCPVCGALKTLIPSRLNTNGGGVPADESPSENAAAEKANIGATRLAAEKAEVEKAAREAAMAEAKRVAAEKAAKEAAEAARLAEEKARIVMKRAAAEAARAEAERVAAEKAAEAARLAAENTASVSSPSSFNERNIHLFFMIDTSGSMNGERIGAVNSSFDELMLELKSMVKDHPGLHIKIAALGFSSGARWITGDGPLPIEQFQWKTIEAGGVTDAGAAFRLLDGILSTETFPGDESGKAEIVSFLLTDGSPTDDWQNELEKLKQNNRFKASGKFGIAIGDDADIDMLKEFTGSAESVVQALDAAWMVNRAVTENTNNSSAHEDDREDNTREDDDVW